VAASARADVVSCVSAALGPMAGPLHGTASRRVRALLDDVAERGAARAVSAHLTRSGRLPGFGHAVYTDVDPRARELLDLLREVRTARRTLRLVDDVGAEALGRGAGHPNVDVALAALGHATGMVPDLAEPIFVVARTAGWIAHALEEWGEGALRFRARAQYVGPG
jgi:citrate synthase